MPGNVMTSISHPRSDITFIHDMTAKTAKTCNTKKLNCSKTLPVGYKVLNSRNPSAQPRGHVIHTNCRHQVRVSTVHLSVLRHHRRSIYSPQHSKFVRHERALYPGKPHVNLREREQTVMKPAIETDHKTILE